MNETATRIPPIEWYGAIAFPGEGIRRIFIGSPSFYGLHEDLQGSMREWMHLNGRNFGKQTLKLEGAAETLIREVTGFYPEVLTSYARRLTEIYEGQSMGPFQFPVEWIVK